MNKFLKKVIFIVPVLFLVSSFLVAKADTGSFGAGLTDAVIVNYQLDKLNYNKSDVMHFIVTAVNNQGTFAISGPCGALNSYSGGNDCTSGSQIFQYPFSNLEMKDLYIIYNCDGSLGCLLSNLNINIYGINLNWMTGFSSSDTNNSYDYTQISTDKILYKNNSIIPTSLLPNIFNYLIPNTATSGSYTTYITMKPIRPGYSVYGKFSAPFIINDPAPQIFVK